MFRMMSEDVTQYAMAVLLMMNILSLILKLVIQGYHMVSDSLALLIVDCCGSDAEAGQRPQRADVL